MHHELDTLSVIVTYSSRLFVLRLSYHSETLYAQPVAHVLLILHTPACAQFLANKTGDNFLFETTQMQVK